MIRPARHRASGPGRLAAAGASLLAASLTMGGWAAALAQGEVQGEPGSVVATTEILGAVVGELVGDAAELTVLIPPGANPHTFEPSARDTERLLAADVVISNGLELEEGLQSVLETAATEGAVWFQAADHLDLRGLEPGTGDDGQAGDGEHAEDDAEAHEHGSVDPHIWTDPLLMREVVLALAPVLAEAGLDVAGNADALVAGLETLDAEVATILAAVPESERKLVTGHRSLGYFADRYGLELIGTVIPSLTTSGEPSARELAQLIADIQDNDVRAVFAEEGTPLSVAQAVADDSGATLFTLSTSRLPEDGTYGSFMRELATTIAAALTG